MKTTNSIADDLFAEAMAFVRQYGMTRSELFQRALIEFLTARRPDFVREMLDRIYSHEDSQIGESIALVQCDTLLAEDW